MTVTVRNSELISTGGLLVRITFYNCLILMIFCEGNIEGIFRKYSIEIMQYCKNIYKDVRKVSKILREPCNVRSKHYKWNIAATLIFHFNIAVM